MDATLFLPVHDPHAEVACTTNWPCELCFATLSTQRQAEIVEAAHEIRFDAVIEGGRAERCADCRNYTVVFDLEVPDVGTLAVCSECTEQRQERRVQRALAAFAAQAMLRSMRHLSSAQNVDVRA